MTFDVCVPAYNEASTIVSVLEALARHVPKGHGWITVAENGSTDDTAGTVERCGIPRVRVLRVAGRGKGLAVRTAALHSDADVFGFIDADLSAHPAAIPEMIDLVAGGADLVVGSRFLHNSEIHRDPIRAGCSHLFRACAGAYLTIPVKDSQCGLKFMSRRARALLIEGKEDGWCFDLELLARVQKAKLSVVEVPVGWEEFRFPGRKSKLRPLRDGLAALGALRRIRDRIS